MLQAQKTQSPPTQTHLTQTCKPSRGAPMLIREYGENAFPCLIDQNPLSTTHFWERSTWRVYCFFCPGNLSITFPGHPPPFRGSVHYSPCSDSYTVQPIAPLLKEPLPLDFHIIKKNFTRKLSPHSIKTGVLHSDEVCLFGAVMIALLGEIDPSQKHSTANAPETERPTPYSPCTTCWTKWGR